MVLRVAGVKLRPWPSIAVGDVRDSRPPFLLQTLAGEVSGHRSSQWTLRGGWFEGGSVFPETAMRKMTQIASLRLYSRLLDRHVRAATPVDMMFMIAVSDCSSKSSIPSANGRPCRSTSGAATRNKVLMQSWGWRWQSCPRPRGIERRSPQIFGFRQGGRLSRQ